MHDIVHDLALLVAQTECYTINSLKCNNICKKVRHVSFSNWNLTVGGVPKFLLDQKKLRTILFPNYRWEPIDKLFFETCTTRFKYLRLLDGRYSSWKVLPSSVGTLKHLRTLDMSGNHTIKKLPNSVCKLFNLQNLHLRGCAALEELPRDIGKLINLRILHVTTKQMQLDKVIGSLTSLQELSFVNCDNMISLGEGMEGLIALRKLSFDYCKKLESISLGMKYLSPGLEDLSIFHCLELNLMEVDHDDFRLTSLQTLKISGLPELESLPGWLQSAANTLQYLSVGQCDNLTALPEWLQNFTSLQRLNIAFCNQLLALPENMHLPTTMGMLVIEGCPDLRRRCERETGEDWHKIAHIPNIILNENYTVESESDSP